MAQGIGRPKPLKILDAGSCAKWRQWLARHHDSESEVWLVFYKPQSGRPSIVYKDALDEALCFGWIDSLVRRLDEDRYARKFTPRKPDSRWSETNRKRYAELEAEGRMTGAGLARPPTGKGYGVRRGFSSTIPAYIQRSLERRPQAWKFFQTLAPSYRRLYIGWIDSAKRQDTKLRRLTEAVELLTAGKKLGLK